MAITTHPNNFTVNLSLGARGSTSNPITASGWSDAGAVITFPDLEPYANIRQGLDGPLEGTLRQGIGGDVTYEFMSSSPTVEWFQARMGELHNAEQVQIQSVVVNSSTGETVRCEDGLLRVARPFPNLGNDGVSVMTFTVRYTNIVADYSNFTPVIVFGA